LGFDSVRRTKFFNVPIPDEEAWMVEARRLAGKPVVAKRKPNETMQ